MHYEKQLDKTLQAVAHWEEALKVYSMDDLRRRPEDGGWSLGQVYVHLIQATLDFQLKRAEACMTSPANQAKGKNFKGILIYRILGGFPPARIKVPPSAEYTPAEPESKEQLQNGLATVRQKVAELAKKLAEANSQGKVAHPAIGFLNADEWFQLIEMHFRHHLRQKKRLDTLLQK